MKRRGYSQTGPLSKRKSGQRGAERNNALRAALQWHKILPIFLIVKNGKSIYCGQY